MRILLKLTLSLVVALAFAALSGWYMLGQRGEGIRNGPWGTNPSVGSEQAGLYLRARIAAYGLWAMRSSEAVYFSAATDSAGDELRHDCSYRIEGTDPDTRWWSMTVYNDDHFIPNPLDRYSLSKTTVKRKADGSWEIRLSRESQGENWLPSGEDGTLILALRCYNPSPELARSPGAATLPQIVPEGCQ